ncbi:hypothetical protein Snas_1397 [Stackebrandtia nassauensis DSM 44728]|uniref:Endonuclease/exonuclease/phosphatase n=1 Tax=Stackebrandtia nassauensis (strain DSM 44728 / CIP 108903 / NRRL B-16338 / NBRC 102104 / LLR-40K-21) TaxID=446470 RepID=D3PV51_STANL|nr:hypothetical protein Snas_1397 [Stackebrandtia nassauensis DSM 44728]
MVKAEQPTILGTQEGRGNQIRDLKDRLPGYWWAWRGREKDGSGETCAAFYRKDRLEKLDEGHRWLSTTPTVPGSISWGAKTMIDGSFHDSWNHKAARVTPTYGTANGWRPRPKPDGRRIDWIIATERFAVHKAGINTWVTRHDNLCSDHWAVQAVVSLAA